MFTYSPPGQLDDLAGRPARINFLGRWHQFILDNVRANIQDLGPSPQFFSEVDGPATGGAIPLSWNGFPLSLARQYGSGTAVWTAADQLQSTTRFTPKGAATVTTQFRPQDEYCEWFAYVDPASKQLRRLAFTAEGPEYWIRLAAVDMARVLELYQQYVDPAVTATDLTLSVDLDYFGERLPAGTYNPFNVWNTSKGALHLTHPSNTLGAEINLAALGTRPMRDSHGARVSDVRRLICCAGYGDANRSSDPAIGWNVNVTCTPLSGSGPVMDATLADPIALYMNNLQPGAITGPAGEPLDAWFQFKRGAAGMGLLAIFEPPSGAAFGLDQVKVKGIPLRFGGQIAELINMVLYAKVRPHAGAAPALGACTSTCCMPAGTPTGKIPSINLQQPRAGNACSAGQVPSYPEIAPQPLQTSGTLAAGAAEVVSIRTKRRVD